VSRLPILEVAASVSPRASALTIQVFSETPSLAAAASSEVFRESGSRSVIRAVSAASSPDGWGAVSSAT
jgi:hypothetical protein